MHWLLTTRWPRTITQMVAMVLLGLLILLPTPPLGAQTASPPSWWAERGVTTPGAAADDYAVINHGQLKNLARAASDEMNAMLPGGAGAEINALIAAWNSPPAGGAMQRDDYAVVTQGQLKTLAALFYDRLATAGLAAGVPWAGSGATPENYAPANIGQAKQLFSFTLDTVPAGSGPSEIPLTLTVLSGGGQSVVAGTAAASPVVVRATREGVPWSGVTVTFTARGGSVSASQTITSSSGNAVVSFTAGSTAGTWPVTATAEEASTVLDFTITTPGGGEPGDPGDPGSSGATPPSPEDLAAAAYEIGLQERRVDVYTEVQVQGPDPGDPTESVSVDYRAYLHPEDPPIWEAGDTILPYFDAAELARGAGLAHDAVEGEDLPDWEPYEPAGYDDSAILRESGSAGAASNSVIGVTSSKAEYRLVRRLKEGAAAPLDANGVIIMPEVRRTYLLVRTKSPNDTLISAETLTLTIDAGETVSGNTSGVLLPPTVETGDHHIRLLPIEITQHPSNVADGTTEPPPTQSARLCRWLDAYDSLGELSTTYPKYDRDRFRIKIPAAAFPAQNKITIRLSTARPPGTNDPEDAPTDIECDKSGDFFVSKPMILVGDGVKPGSGLNGDDAWSAVPPADELPNDVTHVAAPGGKIRIELPLTGSPSIDFDIAGYTHKIQLRTYVVRSPGSSSRIPSQFGGQLEDAVIRAKDVYRQAHIKVEHQGPYDCVLTDAELDLINSDRGDGARTLLITGGNANYLEDGESQFVFDKVLALDGGGPNVIRIVFVDCDYVGRSRNYLALTVRDQWNNKYGAYEGFIAIPIKNAEDQVILSHEVGHAVNLMHPTNDSGVPNGMPHMLMLHHSTSTWQNHTEYLEKRFRRTDLNIMLSVPRAPFIQPIP